MITKEGVRDPEPKSTPEDMKASEVKEEVTGTSQKETQEQPKSKKGEGDSAKFDEELSKMKSELGRLKQELGDARKEAEDYKPYKMWYDQNRQQVQQQQPRQEPNYDEEFFDKPTQTMQKILSQYEMRRTYQDAFQSAPTALAQAKMMYPERFEGVDENMISQIMYAPVQQGQMNPMVLKDPNMWAGAAWIAKGYQSGYKIPEPAPQGMNPSESERPGPPPQSRDDEPVSLRGDDLTDMLIGELMRTGLTRDEAIKEVQATREEGR